MSHHNVIIDKFPKLVENGKFCLESSVLLIFGTFTNILASTILARRVLLEYHSHTPGSFLEFDPPGRCFREWGALLVVQKETLRLDVRK